MRTLGLVTTYLDTGADFDSEVDLPDIFSFASWLSLLDSVHVLARYTLLINIHYVSSRSIDFTWNSCGRDDLWLSCH